jgi:putative transposase
MDHPVGHHLIQRWALAGVVLGAPTRRRCPDRRTTTRPIVGVDLGVTHLATLSVPVAGLSDTNGHVANLWHLDAELERLAKLNR